MFELCLVIPRIQIIMPKAIFCVVGENNAKETGTAIKPNIEANETYPEITKIIIQIAKINKAIFKLKAAITPNVVETPFPPLNFKKGEKSCPIIAKDDSNNRLVSFMLNNLSPI